MFRYLFLLVFPVVFFAGYVIILDPKIGETFPRLLVDTLQDFGIGKGFDYANALEWRDPDYSFYEMIFMVGMAVPIILTFIIMVIIVFFTRRYRASVVRGTAETSQMETITRTHISGNTQTGYTSSNSTERNWHCRVVTEDGQHYTQVYGVAVNPGDKVSYHWINGQRAGNTNNTTGQYCWYFGSSFKWFDWLLVLIPYVGMLAFAFVIGIFMIDFESTEAEGIQEYILFYKDKAYLAWTVVVVLSVYFLRKLFQRAGFRRKAKKLAAAG